ncbi:hypothetical protein GCM10025857_15340 [Alicyclobacillus contaminans]|uniref:hypothetical protein n=1 Tax=Alicyclobacillus contaminans TaxID=392016 RepID=UPI0004235EFE|nr:hypothetical protein [Alicyclobacillus contaminans]GMA50177.1 hypothetical protein GCM10025857_15340 [Alicyclobacillus contaminans]
MELTRVVRHSADYQPSHRVALILDHLQEVLADLVDELSVDCEDVCVNLTISAR